MAYKSNSLVPGSTVNSDKMTSSRIVLFFLPVLCVAARSTEEVIEENQKLEACFKEWGYHDRNEESQNIPLLLLNNTAAIPEPRYEGKCLLFCMGHAVGQVDENGRPVPGKFVPATPELKAEVEKCEEKLEKYQDKCERIYQTVMCVRESEALYTAVLENFE